MRPGARDLGGRPAELAPRSRACVPMKQSEVSRRLLPSPLHSLILWTEIWDSRKREGGEGAPAWRWQRAGWHPRGRPGRVPWLSGSGCRGEEWGGWGVRGFERVLEYAGVQGAELPVKQGL